MGIFTDFILFSKSFTVRTYSRRLDDHYISLDPNINCVGFAKFTQILE